LFYLRKHSILYGWMEALHRRKGGTAESFNCVPVRLDLADVDALEAAVKADGLPETESFFFGVSDGSEKADGLDFIRKGPRGHRGWLHRLLFELMVTGSPMAWRTLHGEPEAFEQPQSRGGLHRLT
jgi:hypothetical protein